MAEVQFMEKELIEPGNQRLEVLSVEKTETYGPQVAFKLKVVGGEHDGYTFVDYATRDEEHGQHQSGHESLEHLRGVPWCWLLQEDQASSGYRGSSVHGEGRAHQDRIEEQGRVRDYRSVAARGAD